MQSNDDYDYDDGDEDEDDEVGDEDEQQEDDFQGVISSDDNYADAEVNDKHLFAKLCLL